MKLSNKVVIRAIALRRQAKLLQFITDTPASMHQIMSQLNEPYRNVNYDLGRLNKIGAIKIAKTAKCPIANRICRFYQSTGVNFEAAPFLEEAEAMGVTELVAQAHKAKSQMNKTRETSKATVLKVEGNPHATVYLNSNKPSGWYKWQKSKKDNVVRAPGCSFSVI